MPPSMQSPDPITAERQAIQNALLRVERRLRLRRILHAAALCGGLLLLGLITWRALTWLGGTVPAATALIALSGIVAGVGMLFLIGRCLLGSAVSIGHAASEADRRGGLHDELMSALWFMRAGAERRPTARAWVEAQLQRAARTASGLQAPRLVPMRLPPSLLAALLAGVIVLVLAWRAPPLTAEPAAQAPAAEAVATANARVNALRKLIEALPQTEARRKLEAALRTLESGAASAGERRQAMAQAQQAVDQIKLDAAASREGLQKLSQMLATRPGLEEAAQALARGDAERAAELVAKAQAQAVEQGAGNAPVPPDATGERPPEQAMQPLTDTVAEAQGARPDGESPQVLAERLKQIARELKAANYVNEAWKEVAGPQMQGARANIMAAGRYDEPQRAVDGDPSPGSSLTPMGGGTRMRAPVVSQGQGTQEQDGGTRMGNAIGDGKVDPLLGEGGGRLDSQLKQQALQGQDDARQNAGQEWFYAESQKGAVRTAWRAVDARARYAEAQATAAGGISINHRQVTKEYFMQRPESVK